MAFGISVAQRQVFAKVADAVRKELEPQGFHVYVNTNKQTLLFTNVSIPFEDQVVWEVSLKERKDPDQ